MESYQRPGLPGRGRGARPHRGDRLGGLPGRPQGAGHAQGRARLRRPRLRALGRLARDAQTRIDARAGRLGQTRRRRRACCWSTARRATTAPAPARSPRPTAWRSWRARCCERDGIEADVLDLSLLTSEYGRHIHPVQGLRLDRACRCATGPAAATRTTRCGQTGDWMNEIYERWVAAHGVILFTPTHWYQAPSPLKLMIDRLVCADGGNPDPTTHPRQEGRRSQGDRAEGLGLSQAPGRPRLRRGGARRRGRHRERCAATSATGSTGWA